MEGSEESTEKSKKVGENGTKETLYITFTRAKADYFLTDKMFRDIGEPNLVRPNPNYRSAAPMKLYLKERLENWITMNTEIVEKTMLRRQKLSKIQKAAHQKRRAKLLSKIKTWIPKLYLKEISIDLMDEAESYYTDRYIDYIGDLTDNALCSFIRHWYTDYEEFLANIDRYKGQTGVKLIYPLVKKRVNDAITEKFCLQIGESID